MTLDQYNRKMPYAKILKYLDEEIDRLQQARELLAGLSTPDGGSRKRIRPATRKRPKTFKSQAPAPEPPVQPAVQVQYLPYKSKTRPQRILRASKSSISPTALTSRVPSGPVAVSADEARKTRQREEELKQSADFAPGRDDDSKRSLSSLIRAMMSREGAGGVHFLSELSGK
jgi:hypothetical protein